MLSEGDLLTMDEAAVVMRAKPATVRSWIYQGKLARVRLGRRHLVRRSDLDAMVQAATGLRKGGAACV